MKKVTMMGDAVSELRKLAEYFEQTAAQYTSGLHSCAQTARDRAAGLQQQPGEELPAWQQKRLEVLLAALGGIRMSAAEHASVQWLAGQELSRVITLGALIQRAVARARSRGHGR